MNRFFIDRPIFAIVISVLITILGGLSLQFLRVEQYPTVVPPQIQVATKYPGASAETVAKSITAKLEQAINGAENMTYMVSTSTSTGDSLVRVFFEPGTDIETAQMEVQNRVNTLKTTLPDEVQRLGVNVFKASNSFIIVIALESLNDEYDSLFLSNYAKIHVIDDLARVNGVNNVVHVGARDYALRIWLDPDAMAGYSVTTTDIIRAVQEQNANYPIGEIGRAPTPENVELTFPVITQGTLSTPEEFENIILRSTDTGATVNLSDVAAVELGATNYDMVGEHNNKETTYLFLYQQYGANALQVKKDVMATMETLSQKFPSGITYSVPFDATLYIKDSVDKVRLSLIEASLLVMIIVFLFLQNIRATFIPVIAMLISIVGTFGGMYLLGLSINTLTLFGLVLATGIVVDDAIVVVENVERNMRQYQYNSRDAAIMTMKEVTGPVIAIVFVLCAVFLPVAFISGMTGILYKQFAITISISVIISGIVALTLSPALSVILLKKHAPYPFLNPLNTVFKKVTDFYSNKTRMLAERKFLAFSIFGIAIVATALFFFFMPKTFIPFEDQGYFVADARLPPSASLNRTKDVSHQLVDRALKIDGIKDVLSISGWNLFEGMAQAQSGSYFILLNDWKDRSSKNLALDTVSKNLEREFYYIPDAKIRNFNPPPILGLAIVSGIESWIVDKSGGSFQRLEDISRNFANKTNALKEMIFMDADIEANNLQLNVDLDREKAKAFGIPISEVNKSLQALLGYIYINDFMKFGRSFQVIMQGDPKFRSSSTDIKKIFLRSSENNMVPLDSLANLNFTKGPTIIHHYNGFQAAKIQGYVNPYYSSLEAMKKIESVAEEMLPDDMSLSYAGQSYEERKGSGATTIIFISALIGVFLILAALFEKWSSPLIVMLVVPFGILGAFISIAIRRMPNDIYFQIGLITLIALAAKNAILIIQFALLKQKEGLSSQEAAFVAARLRFRAIVMTSLTFIVGVIPLVFSTGPGAASRHSVGTGVFGGMILATFFGIVFVPFFYQLIERKK